MPTSNPETKNSRKLHQDLQDLRSLYQALNRHEPFEKVAAAFNAKDLEFLLTNTNSLKLTYIVDTGDSPRGAALRQWVNAGVIAHLARSAAKGGYTPKTLQRAAELATTFGPSRSHDGWLEVIAKYPRPLRFIQDCAAAQFDGPWLDAGLKSGIDFEMLRDLRKLGVPARFVINDIVIGSASGNAVQQWFSARISPWAVSQFIKVKLDASKALAWLQAGFIPEEIVDRAKAREALKACKAKQPHIPYSQAFRRMGNGVFGIAGPYQHRVRQAVSALDAARDYQSSMYSSAHDESSFLDGGYVSVSGYGFGSHSYSIIRGERALRFLCFRVGVQPPRSRRGSEILSQEDLEQEFLGQLRNCDKSSTSQGALTARVGVGI